MNDLIADIEKKVKEFLKQVPFLNNLIFGKNNEPDSSENTVDSQAAGDKTSVSRVNLLADMKAENSSGSQNKPKLKRVHIIALAIIAYLLMDDELLNFNPPPVDPEQAKKVEMQNLEKIKAAIDKIPEAKPVVPVAAPVVEATPVVTEVVPVNTPVVEVTPPTIEDATLTGPDPMPTPTQEVAQIEEATIEAPVNFTEPEVAEETQAETIEMTEALPAETETESQAELPVTEDVVNTEALGQGEGSVSDVTPPQNVTEDILEDLENQFSQKVKERNEKLFYSIPRYEFIGRGLVYSCTGKHWACVNAENYGKCEKNYNFLKNIDRSKECYPAEVYATNEDCFNAQQSKIDSTPKSEFCK